MVPFFNLICLRGLNRTSKPILVCAAIVSLSIFVVFNFFKAGPINAIDFLRKDPEVTSVLFITKCHHTPFYSALHKNIPMRFPDCSPKGRLAGTEEGLMLERRT